MRSKLEVLFAVGPEALGSMMAGRAEEGINDPANASLSVSILASDILREFAGDPPITRYE